MNLMNDGLSDHPAAENEPDEKSQPDRIVTIPRWLAFSSQAMGMGCIFGAGWLIGSAGPHTHEDQQSWAGIAVLIIGCTIINQLLTLAKNRRL